MSDASNRPQPRTPPLPVSLPLHVTIQRTSLTSPPRPSEMNISAKWSISAPSASSAAFST
eukprot:scaffold20505_cov76-Isochrysis_galbana.AAC.2